MIDHSPLSPDRFFAAEPGQRKIARQLYASVLNLPLVCPCVSLNPDLFSDPTNTLGDPCDLLILSDENIVRRLKLQGMNVERHGQKGRDAKNRESENRKIWQFLVDNSLVIRGIPADIWLAEIIYSVFGIKEKLVTKNAQRIYDAVCESLQRPEFRTLRMLERFNIEILGIVESPVDPSLNFSQPAWAGKIIPCLNAGPLFQVHLPDWHKTIRQLSDSSQINVVDYASFIRAVQKQRSLFKTFGATTIVLPMSVSKGDPCEKTELDTILKRGFDQEATPNDTRQLINHMFSEMTTMSMDDKLVLQIYPWSNLHPAGLSSRSVIPSTSFIDEQAADTRKSLKDLLGEKNPISMIHFPAGLQSMNEVESLIEEFPFSKIGVPAWFFNGLSSIKHYFDNYVDNFGWHRVAGLNTNAGSLLTLPSQHDIWRRASANWLASLVVHGLVDLENAYEIIYSLAYSQVKSSYRL